MKSAVIHSLRF